MAAFREELQKAHHRHDLALCLLIPGIVVLWVGGLAPADPEISLRIYYAHAGEAVFAIARRFHVAPAQMRAANGLEADLAVLPQAQHLLVPGT